MWKVLVNVLFEALDGLIYHLKSLIQSGNHVFLTARVVHVWLQDKVGLVEFVAVDRQVIKQCVHGSDSIDKVAIVVVGGGISCAESTQVLEFDTNSTDSVDKGIDCLGNQRSCC